MSRLEAVNQFENALKQGKKYYNTCVSRNEDPYPAVLDELVNMSSLAAVNIGLVDVPIDRIIGTWTGGRLLSIIPCLKRTGSWKSRFPSRGR